MQTKLIQIKDYLLLIDEEAEIKEGNYRVHIYEKTLNHPVHRLEHGENTFDTWKLVLAYYPLTKEAKELDLPLLPPFEEVNSALNNYISSYKSKFDPDRDIYAKGIKTGFIAGYKAAQQSNKQFSLEDINKAIAFGFGICRKEDRAPFNLEINEFIQSLSTQQLPKEFEPRMYPKYTQYDGFEEDDEIPVMTPMTFTNSEGKQELVGIYKY